MSDFDFDNDTILDFTKGICEILGYYLFIKLKEMKHKPRTVFLNDDHGFLHVLIYFKGHYIDIRKIHTEEETLNIYKGRETYIEFIDYQNEWKQRIESTLFYNISDRRHAKKCVNQILTHKAFIDKFGKQPNFIPYNI